MARYRNYPKPINLGAFSTTDTCGSFISIDRLSKILDRDNNEILHMALLGELRLAVRMEPVRHYPHNWLELSDMVKQQLNLLDGPKNRFILFLNQSQIESFMIANEQSVQGGDYWLKRYEDESSIKYEVLSVAFFNSEMITLENVGAYAEDVSAYISKLDKSTLDNLTEGIQKDVAPIHVDWAKVTISVYPKKIVSRYENQILRKDIYESKLYSSNRKIKKEGDLFYKMMTGGFPGVADKQTMLRLRKIVKGWLNAENDPFYIYTANKIEKQYRPRFKLEGRRDDENERRRPSEQLDDNQYFDTVGFESEDDEAAEFLKSHGVNGTKPDIL